MMEGVLSNFDPENAASILHLSDLHFGGDKDSDPVADAGRWYNQLAGDLLQELGCRRLDAVIISGDIANFSVSEEYKAAGVFLERSRSRSRTHHQRSISQTASGRCDVGLGRDP